MKIIKFTAIALLFVFFTLTAYGNSTFIYGSFKKNGLTIISYSDKWKSKDLLKVYEELLNNFHSWELDCLSKIYLYPNSYNGISGLYTNDITVEDKGLILGKNAYIKLYNVDSYSSPNDFAYALSHEYGHHFTLYNISKAEGAYFDKWENSTYSKLRSLKNYPVSYSASVDFDYSWDILEIAANDYVQLLGSPNAKQTYPYKDTAQTLETENNQSEYISIHFNAKPQANTVLPLAAEVDGLWEYFQIIAGKTLEEGQTPSITKKPEITKIESETTFLNKKYTIHFSPAEGNSPFEYTLVMYPLDFPFLVRAVKNVKDNEELTAIIGTVVEYDEKGNLYGIFDYFTDKYQFKIFAKDKNGFYYSSPAFTYDFGQDSFDVYSWLKKI